MLSFILFLIIIWIILGIIGAVAHGLFWLLILAVIGFIATVAFGGTRLRARR